MTRTRRPWPPSAFRLKARMRLLSYPIELRTETNFFVNNQLTGSFEGTDESVLAHLALRILIAALALGRIVPTVFHERCRAGALCIMHYGADPRRPGIGVEKAHRVDHGLSMHVLGHFGEQVDLEALHVTAQLRERMRREGAVGLEGW